MDKTNLVELLKDAQTMSDVFNALKRMEIMQHPTLGSSYVPLEARAEFVILQDRGDDEQLIHPYGTQVTYFIHNPEPNAPRD